MEGGGSLGAGNVAVRGKTGEKIVWENTLISQNKAFLRRRIGRKKRYSS